MKSVISLLKSLLRFISACPSCLLIISPGGFFYRALPECTVLLLQPFPEEPPSPAKTEDEQLGKRRNSPEPGKGNRIWTIARFSLEETDQVSYIHAQQQGRNAT